MRRIVGNIEPDVIIGSDKDQNRGCMTSNSLRNLYEAQASCGRCFVHEQTSEVYSRLRCVTKIMAVPGTRTKVADLYMFGLAACDEGGPGFVNASVRTVTNARQVGMWMQRKCTGTHRHACVGADTAGEKME